MSGSTKDRPQVVSWNLTQGCNLRCPHCYLAAGRPAEDELTTEEGLELIDRLAEAGTQLLILTGGEPLLRRDLCTLARHAADRGLMVVLGTNGTLIDGKTAKKLKESGVQGIGISLDSLAPAKHDAFRGLRGAWEKAICALKICVKQGLEVVVQTSVLPMNYEEIPQLIAFAYETGARAFNAYFLVCTGRGEQLTDITPQQYEALLNHLIDAQARYSDEQRGFLVRAKCAPHIQRLAYERLNSQAVQQSLAAMGAVGLLASVGCPAGTHYLRITPQGDVTPCPYLPVVLGNVRHSRLRQIWESSEVLQKLRTLELGGRCGACEFKQRCVGCRARAFALSGDLLGEDPWCTYQPGWADHKQAEGSHPVWTLEARARLEKIPSFIRGRVQEGLEAYARARDLHQITPELLAELRAACLRKKKKKKDEKDRHV